MCVRERERRERERERIKKGLQLREELNAAVARIADHQGVVIIHAHPGWVVEFSKSSTFTTITLFAQLLNQAEGLTRIKDSDHMEWVTTSDMQVTMQVHAQSSYPSTTDLEVEEVLLATTTPHRNSIVVLIGHAQHGRRREGRVQIADGRRPMRLLITSSILAKGGDEATRDIKELNLIVPCVGHRDVSIGSTTYSLWRTESSLLLASFISCFSNGVEWNW